MSPRYVKGLYLGRWRYGWAIGSIGFGRYYNLIEVDQEKHPKVGYSAKPYVPAGYKNVQSHIPYIEIYSWVAKVYDVKHRPQKHLTHSYAISSKKVKDGIKVGDKWITQKPAPKRANVKKT